MTIGIILINTRFGVGCAFSVVYGALLTKTNRIFRIFQVHVMMMTIIMILRWIKFLGKTTLMMMTIIAKIFLVDYLKRCQSFFWKENLNLRQWFLKIPVFRRPASLQPGLTLYLQGDKHFFFKCPNRNFIQEKFIDIFSEQTFQDKFHIFFQT